MSALTPDQKAIVNQIIAEVQRAKGDLGTLLEISKNIDKMSNDNQAMLLALMSLGRGDPDETAETFPDLVEEKKNNTDHTGGYLTDKEPLATYLQEGLKKLGM